MKRVYANLFLVADADYGAGSDFAHVEAVRSNAPFRTSRDVLNTTTQLLDALDQAGLKNSRTKILIDARQALDEKPHHHRAWNKLLVHVAKALGYVAVLVRSNQEVLELSDRPQNLHLFTKLEGARRALHAMGQSQRPPVEHASSRREDCTANTQLGHAAQLTDGERGGEARHNEQSASNGGEQRTPVP